MKKEEFYYDSKCNNNKIHAVKWVPSGTPLCIIHIVHGMAEHIGRYEEFATYLTRRNILVVGEDHLGHGKSMGNNPPGYFCENNPANVLVEDVHGLKELVRKEYPDIPYVLFGHSMGSFVTRNFVHKYGSEIDGAIIEGTGMIPKGLIHVMKAITGLFIACRGTRHVSEFVNNMAFGSYMKRIKSPKSKFDWMTKDEEELQRFLEDPLCGFTFTLNGFVGMGDLILGLYDKDGIASVPKDLPLYFLYGEEDPVGDYGVSARKSYCTYVNAGMKRVLEKRYSGCRHELLHETNRTCVMDDIYEWMKKEGVIG